MDSFFKRRAHATPEQVENALAGVTHPHTGAPLPDFAGISGLSVRNGAVRFVLSLPAEEHEHAPALEAACRAAIKRLPGVKEVLAVVTAERSAAPPPAAPRARAQWNTEPLAHVARVVAVASGKGGVGKSTTAVGVARALAARGKRVGLLDADIHGPSLPRMMGLTRDSGLGIQDSAFMPPEAGGVKCMSMGFLLEGAAVMRGPMVTKSLARLLRGTRWGTAEAPLDLLLVDFPPGTGDVHLSMMQSVPLGYGGGGALIVTTPQEVALDDARKAAEMFRKIGVPILGVVENMSFFTDPAGHVHRLFGAGGGKRLAEELGVPLLAELPLDPELGRAMEAGNAPPPGFYDALAARLDTAS
jgi:ATP-binding protein involved in chromosome partitioning